MNNIEKAIEALKELEINSDETRFQMARIMGITALQHELACCWIPVSERFPGGDEYIRIYATLRYKETGHIFSDRLRWEYGKFKWFNGSRLSGKYEVIAWMPDNLPEPYREDRHG